MKTFIRNLTLAFWVVWLVPACAPKQVGECLGVAVGGALSRLVGLALYEGAHPLDRPDEVRATGGLWVGGAHEGGRLVLTFDGPPVSGELPRNLGDGGCESVGDFAFLFHSGPDAGSSELLTATLVVTQTARTDAGVPTLFRLTGIAARLEDGGTRAVSNRDLNLVLP